MCRLCDIQDRRRREALETDPAARAREIEQNRELYARNAARRERIDSKRGGWIWPEDGGAR
jgi:hypothetical protein